MAFTIHTAGGGRKSFDDDHTMVVKDSGVIEVTKDQEQVMLFSPSYWTYAAPGTPKPRKATRIR